RSRSSRARTRPLISGSTASPNSTDKAQSPQARILGVFTLRSLSEPKTNLLLFSHEGESRNATSARLPSKYSRTKAGRFSFPEGRLSFLDRTVLCLLDEHYPTSRSDWEPFIMILKSKNAVVTGST